MKTLWNIQLTDNKKKKYTNRFIFFLTSMNVVKDWSYYEWTKQQLGLTLTKEIMCFSLIFLQYSLTEIILIIHSLYTSHTNLAEFTLVLMSSNTLYKVLLKLQIFF